MPMATLTEEEEIILTFDVSDEALEIAKRQDQLYVGGMHSEPAGVPSVNLCERPTTAGL